MRVTFSRAVLAALLGFGPVGSGCVMVRAEERAVLADPIMQFQASRSRMALRHVLDNREGASGGEGVEGGGCGCN